jgi:hypothetical protein
LKQKHVSTALERVSWQQGSAALSTYTTLNLKSCKHEIKGYELQAIEIQHSKHFNFTPNLGSFNQDPLENKASRGGKNIHFNIRMTKSL